MQVDECLIKDSNGGKLRCDYLFEINVPCAEVFYLELKGCDIEKAFKQLEATIDMCEKTSCQYQKEKFYCGFAYTKSKS